MIRSVQIPTTVSRMGCSPGGDCCSDCASHKLGAVRMERIPSVRNIRLHSSLGDVCDPETDMLGCAAPDQITPMQMDAIAAANSPGATSKTAIYVMAAAGFIALFELISGGGRR